MQQRPTHEPVFNAPTVVLALIGIMVAIHVLRLLVSVNADDWILGAAALIPARFTGLAEQLPGGIPAIFTSPVTHMFLHGNAPHLIFNSLWLLAFGSAIALRVGAVRFLAFSLMTGLVGAALYTFFNWGLITPVVGASGAISGLLGGVMRFLFRAFDYGGIHVLRESPRSIPLMTLQETFTDRRVLAMIAIWLFLNLISVFGNDGLNAGGGVAWEAHVGGFVAGLLGFGLFDGQWPRQRNKKPKLRVVH